MDTFNNSSTTKCFSPTSRLFLQVGQHILNIRHHLLQFCEWCLVISMLSFPRYNVNDGNGLQLKYGFENRFQVTNFPSRGFLDSRIFSISGQWNRKTNVIRSI
eukprot:944100_1